MIRRVPTSRTNKDVHEPKACGYRDKEVAGKNGVRMVPHKRRPALGRSAAAGPPERSQIASDRARRDGQPEFQTQFIGDPFFAPRRVRPSHRDNQSPHVDRDRWSAGHGLPPPEETEPFPMPPDQCLWLHDGERRPPIDQPGQYRRASAGSHRPPGVIGRDAPRKARAASEGRDSRPANAIASGGQATGT